MPLVGAWVADTHWGRFKTIMWSIGCALVGHSILVISTIPPVIARNNASVGIFVVGLIIMGVGTGGFKYVFFLVENLGAELTRNRSNISPLIAEQYKAGDPYISHDKKGRRIIVDPAATISRIYHYFYLMINVGALAGQLSMVYAEKYVGFWLSFVLPTFLFCLCPMVLFLCRNLYVRRPPQGSIYGKAFKVWRLSMKGRFSINPVQT